MHDYWTLMKKLIWLRILQGASFVVNKITGTSPITLTNAINSAIISLKQYGKCVQDGTPTPSAPVDIVCNNGALKYGATGKNKWNSHNFVLEESSGITIDGDNSLTISNKAYQETLNSYDISKYHGLAKVISFKCETLAKPTDNAYFYISEETMDAANAWAKITLGDVGDVENYTVTVPVNADTARFGGWAWAGTVELTEIQLELNSQATSYEPYVGGVIADGTPEVLTVSGANLLDPQTVPGNNQFIGRNNGDTITPSASGGVWRHSDYIPVIGGETYYFHQINAAASTAGTAWYNSEQTYVGGINATALANNGNKVTMPANAAYLRHSWRIDEGYNTNWENTVYICIDGTMSEFHPYVEPQTVNDVATLLAVGNYADEQDIISGLVTRKCRAKVLDGTESYTKANSGDTVRFRLNNVSDLITGSGMGRIPAIYSHFQDLSSASSQSLGGAFAFPGRVIYFIPTDQTLDLNGWKSWVAQQYDEGTPVIVIYPLAQETTESVTLQPLNTTNGTNVVEVTSNVDPVILEVEYKANR